MDGLFGSGNKRHFMGPQGDKYDPQNGVDSDRAARDAADPVVRASSDTMKTRRIVAPKSRRAGASRDGSVDRQLGNPFAQVPGAASTNASNGFNATPFGQQSVFGSSASQSFPPNNNTSSFAQSSSQPFAFGSQPSSSFPPASNPFGQQQQQQQPPAPPSGAFTFGASAPVATQSNPFSFGASTPQPTPSAPSFSFSSTTTTKPAFNNGSAFNFNSSSTPSIKPVESSNLFGATSNGFNFGAAANQSTTPASTAAANPFASQTPSSQPAGGLFSTKPTTTSSLFGAPAASTPSQNTPLFGANPVASSTPAAGFVQHGISNTDDMMTSPPATPPKKTAAANEQPPASSTTTPAFKPAVVDNPFAGIKMPPPTPSAQASVSSPFQASQPFTPFAQPTPKAPNTTKAPPTNIFASQPETASPAKETPSAAAPSLSMFAPAPSAETPNAKPSLFSPAPQAPTPATKQTFAPAATPSAQSHSSSAAPERAGSKAQEQYRRLNQSFKARLLSMNEDYDWSPMFQAYLAQVERMKESFTSKPATKRPLGLDAEDSEPKRARSAEPEPEQRVPVPATPPVQQPVSNLFAPQPSTTPTSSPSKSQTANLFASIVGNTPQQSTPQPSNSFFSPKPAAAAQATPAPAQGSNLFANPPASAAQTPSLFGAATTAAPPKPAVSASSPQKQSAEQDEQPPNPFSSMKKMPAQPSPPKAPAEAAPAAPAPPKFELPKFSVPAASDAFAAFGAQAEKSKLEAEKAAEKKELDARFDDEYDSDNETEAAFNKRVLAEIRAKRAKAKEEKAAAPAQAVFQPGKGFSFTSTTSSSGKGAESQETPPSSAEVTPETAKPSLFSPAPSTAVGGQSIFDTAVKPNAPSSGLFGNLAKPPPPQAEDEGDSADDGQSEAPSQADSNGVSGSSKSLFERISKSSGSENTTLNGHTSESPGGLFGAQDHTWKNDSPIKFGDSTGPSTTPTKSNGAGFGDLTTPAPKPFTNIFGSAKANSTPSLFSQSTAKPPAVGFAFGTSSNGTSDAASVSPSSTREGSVAATTTTTTDENAQSSNGDGGVNLDGAAADAQVSLTDLSEEERRDNDVLFEVSSARVQAYDGKAKTWQKRGLGPLRVLKSKESGKTWILARSNPQGKVIINTALLKGMSYDSPAKGRVKFPMVDRDGGKMTTVLVTVKADEDAKKLAEVLSAHKPE